MKRVLIGIVGLPNALLGVLAAYMYGYMLVVDPGMNLLRSSPLLLGIWLSYGYVLAFVSNRTPLLSWRSFWTVSAVANALLLAGEGWLMIAGRLSTRMDEVSIMAWQATVFILSLVIGHRHAPRTAQASSHDAPPSHSS